MTTTSPFFMARLSEGPLVADGALGTMLLAGRDRFDGCLEELNLAAPGDVSRIHREYIRAGAEIIQTNTFGANRIRLSRFGLGDAVDSINRAGVDLARQAAGEGAFVAGSVGPLGCSISKAAEGADGADRIAPSEARAAFREQMRALIEAGSDFILLETFSSHAELREALSAAREDLSVAIPLVVQFTVNEAGDLAHGAGIDESLRFVSRWQPDVVGCNCSEGPASLEASLKVLLAQAGGPVSAQPSAGLPQSEAARPIYPCGPEDFGAWAAWAIDAGVSIIGGCCGTTPDHVRAMRAAADERPKRISSSVAAGVHNFTGSGASER